MMPADSGLAFEVRAFVLCALSGVACAFLYDFFKIIRRTIRSGQGLTFILDLLFWLCAAFLMFGMLLFANYGRMRIFEATAVLLGAIVYFFSISNVVVTCGTAVVNRLLLFLFWVLKILFFPVRLLNRYLIFPVCAKIAKKIRKIRKKRLTIRLFWFRINKGMVFLRKYRQK